MNWAYALGTALGNTYTHLGRADAVGWADLLCVSVQLGTQFSEWFLCESLWAFALSVCALSLDTYSLTAWSAQASGLKTQLITSSAKPSLTAPSPSIPAHFLLRLCSQAPPPTARLALHRLFIGMLRVCICLVGRGSHLLSPGPCSVPGAKWGAQNSLLNE